MVCSNGSSGKKGGGGGGKVKSWYKRSIVVSSGSNSSNSAHASVVVLVLRTLPFDSSSLRDSNNLSIPDREPVAIKRFDDLAKMLCDECCCLQ